MGRTMPRRSADSLERFEFPKLFQRADDHTKCCWKDLHQLQVEKVGRLFLCALALRLCIALHIAPQHFLKDRNL